jgi:hypothetical protein
MAHLYTNLTHIGVVILSSIMVGYLPLIRTL